MLVGTIRYGLWVVSITYISEGYPYAFRCDVFLACPRMCLNISLPRLNFFFMPI